MCAEIDALTTLDLEGVDGLNGPALHQDMRRASDKLQAFAARVLARVEADGRWATSGSRTFPDWMACQELASYGAVRREVTLGRALDEDLPATAQEISVGGVTLEHAQVLARLGPTSDARRAALASGAPDRNEAYLVERAKALPVDEYRREVQRWATRVDADAAEREHDQACAKEHLTFSRKDDGVAFQGFLTAEHGHALATALRAVAGVPSVGDQRSREERQAAALVDAARIVLDRGLAGGGQQVRPHISVHVSWEALLRLQATHLDGPADGSANGGADGSADVSLVAQLDDGRPVPGSLLARIACDSEISRIVFGPRGDVLDVGRAQRTYSGQQRRAVIARDRSCRYPGCGAPPTLGEVHHVVPWLQGGVTSIRNGILLCWFHHDLVHRRGVVIRSDPRRAWRFFRRDGTSLDDGPTSGDGGAPAGAPADGSRGAGRGVGGRDAEGDVGGRGAASGAGRGGMASGAGVTALARAAPLAADSPGDAAQPELDLTG
ncbi:HNH endonuclease signature motif containing protein [Actinotalea subterranea]|uniref:HNH endonuclease signature motif containing protein n=1 Tax=Actinotalea subterranea TaxID=2607497 RepID=UPI00165D6573|nr:HNH endonuclease signature motif containing protein [Actinotalea subterranea]